MIKTLVIGSFVAAIVFAAMSPFTEQIADASTRAVDYITNLV